MNAKGFSLTEALAALAISTVVGAAMWSVIQNALDSSNQFVDRQELDELARQSQYILMREQTCANAMRRADGSPGGVPVTFDAVTGTGVVDSIVSQNEALEDSILVQAGQNFGRVRVETMTLRKSIANSASTPELVYRRGDANPTPMDTYLVNLEITTRNRSGRALPPRALPLKIYVNRTTNLIENCFVTHGDNQTCASFGGQFNANRGICEMPVCNATVAQATPGGSTDCPPPSGTCSAAVYFWSFRSASADPTVPSDPVCLCSRSCLPPAPAPTPGGY